MKLTLLILVLALLAGMLACGGDDDTVTPTPIGPDWPVFQNRTEKWHVLNNLELAYNQRKIDNVRNLLDQDFTFYLTDKDVQSGLPEAWDRAVEISITTNLFSKDPPGEMPAVKSIRLDILWEDNLAWVETAAPINDETWYMATCFVNFKIEVEPDLTFISNNGTKAQFVVRNAGTDEQPRWTLVEMRDLGAPSSPSAVSALMATEPATWGHVKALFI